VARPKHVKTPLLRNEATVMLEAGSQRRRKRYARVGDCQRDVCGLYTQCVCV
jgi:hypothetical protein